MHCHLQLCIMALAGVNDADNQEEESDTEVNSEDASCSAKISTALLNSHHWQLGCGHHPTPLFLSGQALQLVSPLNAVGHLAP